MGGKQKKTEGNKEETGRERDEIGDGKEQLKREGRERRLIEMKQRIRKNRNKRSYEKATETDETGKNIKQIK